MDSEYLPSSSQSRLDLAGDKSRETAIWRRDDSSLSRENSRFDYVFCFTDFHSKNELKRNPEDESSKPHKPAEKLLKADNNVIPEEVLCSICREIMSRYATGNPGGHNFCGDCLIDHLRNSLLCPVCETRISSVTKNLALHSFIEAAMRDSAHLQRRESNRKVKIQNDLGGDVFLIENEIFIGLTIDDRKEGQGTLVYPDGGIHQGIWKNGLKEGEGVWLIKNGVVIKGLWSKDSLQKDVEITFANKDFYKGEIKDMKRHGKGIMIYVNGGIYEGD